ncbi:MAG: DUF547 domain-containing protein, partial [Candidatus Moduliflexus flocculans]|nr:DUF547 domain-containing protein [Candidatus Moduliflexus flocculans]
PREEQFAFYINAYNAWTIKLILTGYPGVKSIKDLGSLLQSPWKKEFVRIHGKTLSLDDIEHSILRPRFKDPRVHFAIVCASKGCPPLHLRALPRRHPGRPAHPGHLRFSERPGQFPAGGQHAAGSVRSSSGSRRISTRMSSAFT